LTIEQVNQIEGRSPAQLAWLRFKKDKVAIFALFFSLFIILLALFAPFVTGQTEIISRKRT